MGKYLVEEKEKPLRLDLALVERGLCDSREQAKRMILAGHVRSDAGHLLDKPSTKINAEFILKLKEKPRYVSRGGLKLEGALEAFSIDVAGKVCLDVGASTGGFTDCLLQRGAARVHAIDVGTNQLVWKLRSDPRVKVREKFNARHLSVEDLGELVDVVVLDVSFISLTKILPAVAKVLKPSADIVPLIKPQFELSSHQVGKGGIVKEEALRKEALEKIRHFVTNVLGHEWKSSILSPITGRDGNQEYLAWIQPTPQQL